MVFYAAGFGCGGYATVSTSNDGYTGSGGGGGYYGGGCGGSCGSGGGGSGYISSVLKNGLTSIGTNTEQLGRCIITVEEIFSPIMFYIKTESGDWRRI